MAENGEVPPVAEAVPVEAPATPAAASGGGEPAAAAATTPKTPDGAPNGTKSAVFRQQFKAFSKFGDPKSDGKHITLSQSDKWMKQAKVIGKVITTTDTGIYFKKLKAQKVSMDDYNKFLEDLARNKKSDIADIKNKLSVCGAPGLTGVHTSTKAQSTVERLTDVSRYTGAHKQRFDETGKGKGLAGRKDLPDASGYVHGYQNKDTYSKSH